MKKFKNPFELYLFLNSGSEFLWVGMSVCLSVEKLKLQILSNRLNESTKVSSKGP